MFNKSLQIYYVIYVSEAFFVQDDDVTWWVDSGATVHVCKDRCWFKTYESLNDGSILHLGNESTALVHERGCVDLSDLCDLHATPSLGNKKYFVTFIDDAFRTDREGEYMNTLYFQSIGIVYETTAPYTLQQNGISERKNRVLKEMVNFMPSYSGLSQGFWGEAMLTAFAINSIIESRDAIFDEHRFSSVSKPSQRSLVKGIKDSGGSVVSERVTDEIVQQSKPELRKSKRQRTPKDFGPEFQLYLIEGIRDEIFDQHSYFFNVEDDPKTYDEAMKSQDVAFWKEAINDAMDSIIGNNTYVLTDLPPAFLNGDLEEDVHMNQPLGFIMPGNENKVCKLIKSLYGLKQAPKQWHQKFDEVVLSSGYLLNQADKCVYNKFDASGKGVIICLYVDDMLIFGTDQVEVDMTKEVLSSRFSMKDIGEDPGYKD
nr:zinc finger, CCHC-type [Tanacetum cinerariifolium]